MDILTIIIYLILLICAIQIIRLIFADGDLVLMWTERFGYKIDKLKNKVVWITGASSGIGEFLAYELASAGCRVVISARNEKELKRVKETCISTYKALESDIFLLPMDVTQIEKHLDYKNSVIAKFGQIDVLVNNAARTHISLVKDTDLALDREIIELNVIAPISLAKTVLPHMLERGDGHIVVTSSLAGKAGMGLFASYCMTKFAVNGWHESLSHETSDKVAVSIICPGPVRTNLLESSYGKEVKTDAINMDAKHIMSAKRCAELMSIAIANKLPEVWISKQPILIFPYLSQYVPSFAYWFFTKCLKK